MQAQLKSGREALVRKACPALTDELVAAMKRAPMRGYDPSILKEPHIYRCCRHIPQTPLSGFAVIRLAMLVWHIVRGEGGGAPLERCGVGHVDLLAQIRRGTARTIPHSELTLVRALLLLPRCATYAAGCGAMTCFLAQLRTTRL